MWQKHSQKSPSRYWYSISRKQTSRWTSSGEGSAAPHSGSMVSSLLIYHCSTCHIHLVSSGYQVRVYDDIFIRIHHCPLFITTPIYFSSPLHSSFYFYSPYMWIYILLRTNNPVKKKSISPFFFLCFFYSFLSLAHTREKRGGGIIFLHYSVFFSHVNTSNVEIPISPSSCHWG